MLFRSAPLDRRLVARLFALTGLTFLLVPLGMINLQFAGAAGIAFLLEVAFLRFARSPGRSWCGIRVGTQVSAIDRLSFPRAFLRTGVAFSPITAIVATEGIGPWRAPIGPVVSASIAGAMLLALIAWPRLFGRALQDIIAGTQSWWWADARHHRAPIVGTVPSPGTSDSRDRAD